MDETRTRSGDASREITPVLIQSLYKGCDALLSGNFRDRRHGATEDKGPEPPTPTLRTQTKALRSDKHLSQTVAHHDVTVSPPVSPSPPKGTFPQIFDTNPTQDSAAPNPRHLRNLLTVRQVAELLNVSTATVYKLCRSGKIPHVRVSNAIRIAVPDLERLVHRNRRSK